MQGLILSRTLPKSPIKNSPRIEFSPHIETPIEFFTASSPIELLPIKPAESLLS